MEKLDFSDLGVKVDDSNFKSSIVKACLKVRVEKVLFCVPFGEVELFLKMALSAKNTIEISASENRELFLV